MPPGDTGHVKMPAVTRGQNQRPEPEADETEVRAIESEGVQVSRKNKTFAFTGLQRLYRRGIQKHSSGGRHSLLPKVPQNGIKMTKFAEEDVFDHPAFYIIYDECSDQTKIGCSGHMNARAAHYRTYWPDSYLVYCRYWPRKSYDDTAALSKRDGYTRPLQNNFELEFKRYINEKKNRKKSREFFRKYPMEELRDALHAMDRIIPANSTEVSPRKSKRLLKEAPEFEGI